MARLSLSKSSLTREQRQLKSFRQYLPSLDLKRRQLIAERAKAAKEVQDLTDALERLKGEIARELPMLADRNIGLTGLVKAKTVHLDRQNVVGTWLPVLASLEVEVRPYSPLAKPPWVDVAAEKLGPNPGRFDHGERIPGFFLEPTRKELVVIGFDPVCPESFFHLAARIDDRGN